MLIKIRFPQINTKNQKLKTKPPGLLLKKPLKNNAEVMKRTTKTEKTAIFENKNMKNKANFNSSNLIATSCRKEAYSDLHPKTQSQTKPI